jgi:hypothetical protein
MGYTHYFKHKKDIDLESWKNVCDGMELVLKNLPASSSTAGGYYTDRPIILQFEDDDPKPVQIDGEVIRFNGAGAMGHETFYVARRLRSGDSPVQFCKTARKPYDFAVCAALILLNHYAPGCNDIESDGDPDDWMPALTYMRDLFGDVDLKLPPGVGEEPVDAEEMFNTSNEWFYA